MSESPAFKYAFLPRSTSGYLKYFTKDYFLNCLFMGKLHIIIFQKSHLTNKTLNLVFIKIFTIFYNDTEYLSEYFIGRLKVCAVFCVLTSSFGNREYTSFKVWHEHLRPKGVFSFSLLYFMLNINVTNMVGCLYFLFVFIGPRPQKLFFKNEVLWEKV